MPTPTDLQRDDDRSITIRWSDGKSTRWTADELRAACPCATCREKKRGTSDDTQEVSGGPKSLSLPVLGIQETLPLEIDSMRPVGSYAYNISFSDGHSSGIFQLTMLYDK